MSKLDVFDQASEILLSPGGLVVEQVSTELANMMPASADFADLFFQHTHYESWALEEGIVRDGSFSIEQGVGARVMSGEKTGFAYADDISLDSLKRIGPLAGAIVKSGGSGTVKPARAVDAQLRYQGDDPAGSVSSADKVALLQKIDSYTRDLDSRVTDVLLSMAAVRDVVLTINTDGALAADIRPIVRFNVRVIVEQNGKRESGSSGGGGRFDLSQMLVDDKLEHFAEEALRQALVSLEAVPAPAGTMPVVLGPGWPGILLHEAVGHGLEGDFNRKGVSAFATRMGEKVASSCCTVVDDATLDNRRGSLNIDDEGTLGQNTTLIENGRLVSYMQDRMNARLMGVNSTGNGRRESYAHLPMPRMTNTYMLPGKYTHDEIIASVKDGIYAANFGGGQVDITSGQFVFSASEAYKISDGKIVEPLKDLTLIGDGPTVMQSISMVGDNLQLDEGVGVCGKEGQSVPVGVGQPSLKIDQLVVGGTA